MKFCDKLQKIRKENNVTQEQLADKLNVSRQAVSKWESGTAYPDTEKLIQISKIFNVSLDELINDNKEGKPNNVKRFNFMETFNMIFNFISKSVNMFWSMTFGEKLKFLFEMIILVLALWGLAAIAKGVILSIIHRIFMFLPSNILRVILSLFDALIYALCFILGGIVFVKVLKTRYLDYYVIVTDENVTEKVVEEPIRELKENKECKVVIRDPKHSGFSLLKTIGKIFVFCLKLLGVFLALPLVTIFITLMVLFVISLCYLLYGLFFNGISVALLGIMAFVLLLIWIIYNLLFNQKNAYQRMFLVFIISISLIGIGVGLSFASLRNFEFVEESRTLGEEQKVTISMKDNLIVPVIMNVSSDKFVVSDEYSDITIIAKTAENLKMDTYTYYTYEDDKAYKVVDAFANYDSIKSFNKVLDDFKDKKINTYALRDDENSFVIEKVYISQANLDKIKDNYKKALKAL